MAGGGKGDRTQTTKVEIPGFLKPFIRQGADVGSDALSQLEGLLGPGTSLVQGFDPAQEAALGQAEAVAGGAGGFIPTAQDALLSTARGDFLAGGPGFDEAVQASIRAAQPNILSSFGRAGRGVSGLGQAAIQRSASDAFANLFNQERSRQLNAASSLPSIGLAGSNILSNVGGARQAQAQRERLGPVEAQERLFGLGSAVTGTQAPLLAGRSSTVSGQGNKLGQTLGAGLSLAGTFSGIPGAGKAGGLVSPGVGLF